jgi:hypothetical protein
MITNSRATRIARRVRRTWAELDYAQRRMFELRTGVSARGQRRSTARIEELERLYHLRSA